MNDINYDLALNLGNRHLRSDLNNKLGAIDLGKRHVVRLNATAPVAATVGGQHTLWLLANLLARQFSVIQEIEICLPKVPLQTGIALFGAEENLPTTIARTVELVAGSTMRVRLTEDPSVEVNAEIIVGLPKRLAKAPFRVGVLGSGWNLFVGDSDCVPDIVPADRNPFGPYFAACIAAGEIFKWLRGLRENRGHYIKSLNLSLWDYAQYGTWTELPSGEWPLSLKLPPLYLIGAGAVGQAVAAALTASRELCGYATIIDGDQIEDTNLNRYLLAIQGDEQVWKSELLAKYLRAGGFEVYPYCSDWPNYAYDSARPPQRNDLLALEAAYRYRLILSCVDTNRARHAIQRFWPEYLIGGSTLELGLSVAAYDMHSPYECLMCSNPIEPAIPSIEAIANELRRLTHQGRHAWAEEHGADLQILEDYLSNPRCGHLGEQEIAKFGNEDRGTDWSVGFVSVAAGTLLAAQLVKHSLLGSTAFPSNLGNTLRFNFLNPRPQWSKHCRRNKCECITNGKSDYGLLWP